MHTMNSFQEAPDLLDTPLDEVRWTVFDLETTGIHPENGDVIIEIAAVSVNESFKIDKNSEFSSFVNPHRTIPCENTLIHGITDADVAFAPDFASVFYNFLDFSRNTVLVAHNAAKDMAFLRAALSEYMQQLPFPVVIDSLRMSRLFNDNSVKHDLQTLSEQFKINGQVKGKAHRALPDARKTAILFRRMMKNIFPKECVQLGELVRLLSLHN